MGRTNVRTAVRSPVLHRLAAVLALFIAFPGAVNAYGNFGPFVAFESGPVRPLAISPDGRLLFVTNTPDNRLEIFRIGDAGLTHVRSVDVGMEPVAVAARTDREVWVLNHLSDSVSIVRLGANGFAHTVRTLKVGDEPRDIVFAGPDRGRAFISTAHRRSFEQEGSWEAGSADVWVFDVNALGSSAEGEPLAVVNLFADVPRALEVSPDGNTVYVATLHSGNQTTALPYQTVLGDLPEPLQNYAGEPIPKIWWNGTDVPGLGLIAKWTGDTWIDGAGRDVSHLVSNRTMTDYDVISLDAAAEVPVPVATVSGVGTTLFNMALHPQTGRLFVSNQEARNIVRFEGPGEYVAGFGLKTVRGHFVEHRITVIDGETVTPRHLNKHIDYDRDLGTQAENDASLAMPLQMAFSADGETLYVAAYSSSKIGVFDVDELVADTFVPSPASHIEISGGGPGGLVLDPARDRMYVYARFNNAVSVVDLVTRSEIGQLAMHNPEPPEVVDGRALLYDARFTSSRGESSCAGCHIFGDKDELSWNLGNPDADVVDDRNPRKPGSFQNNRFFHPMKGPMVTQSLRGLQRTGPMHWRGDRTGSSDGGDALDEVAAMNTFNVAFEGLLARSAPLTDEEMQRLTDYVLQLHYPPNPLRAIDNSLTPSQELGKFTYFNDPVFDKTCHDCHRLEPELGIFGADGLAIIHPEVVQTMKVPHFRNAYTRVGLREAGPGEQLLHYRGFGFLHDGVVECPCPRTLPPLQIGEDGAPVAPAQSAASPNVAALLAAHPFLEPSERITRGNDDELPPIDHITNYMMVYPTDLAPIVGQQATFPGVGSGEKLRIMLERAAVTGIREECDLIAKGYVNGEARGWVRLETGEFQSDRAAEVTTVGQLVQAANQPGQYVTFTCTPPGSGVRMGIDRDLDGVYDGDEAARPRLTKLD